MRVSRNELENTLQDVILEIKHDKKKVKNIKTGLKAYSIPPGAVQSYFANPQENLPELDLRILCLLAEEIYLETMIDDFNPKNIFEEQELKVARTFDYSLLSSINIIDFPIYLNNVIMIDSENYVTVWNAKFIKQLMDNQLLRYNFDTQREHIKVKRNNTIQKVINLNSKSVDEIAQAALKGELEKTTITINALVGTADDGEELEYDAKKMQLIIKNGTFLDIVDGMHRISGIINALESNPELEHEFIISIKNFNTKQAQRHLAQISTFNPISKTHIEALKESRKSDMVVRHLMRESDLKGRVSQTSTPKPTLGEIVSYNTLADTIDEEFQMKTKLDAEEVGEYLTKFFDHLIGTYSEEFVDNLGKDRNLISENIMFAGYIILARKMLDDKIKIRNLKEIIDELNITRDNEVWEKAGVLDKNKIFVSTAKSKVKMYFRNLELNKFRVAGGIE
ncbi:DNA sulfur modification protein DndB [Peribacillus loiseleuriae]|uniref:DGQHR domain-containing protein n=1 Tax=Peribacillus loiseleuriae TaxID=1679170 RepID=A0A0K9GSF5_9BACI|nr:DNA sulfur modification protein DndB [Peribacillus loiseleuriae]KMY49619.1 hypothetical protein AC625_08755 [Peribacillus loiseleuriae]